MRCQTELPWIARTGTPTASPNCYATDQPRDTLRMGRDWPVKPTIRPEPIGTTGPHTRAKRRHLPRIRPVRPAIVDPVICTSYAGDALRTFGAPFDSRDELVRVGNPAKQSLGHQKRCFMVAAPQFTANRFTNAVGQQHTAVVPEHRISNR